MAGKMGTIGSGGRGRRRLAVGLGASGSALALVAAAGLGAGVVRAQDGEAARPAHPAHIHVGTCEELGDVVIPLTDVGPMGLTQGVTGGTPAVEAGSRALAEGMGPESAVPVETSYTLVDAPLTEIIEGGHAINVHESAENIGEYIACGDVGGLLEGGPGIDLGPTLSIGLRELNGSGYAGVALLQEQGEQTAVTVLLAEGLSGPGTAAGGEGAGTPAAGSDDAAAAEEVAVTIEDYAYGPAEVTIPVGGTVSWTNQDSVPHTATGQESADFQSGTLRQGESFSQGFDEAGTYEYRCEFHANMNGTIVVE